jgi:hypothetical protein
VRGQAGSEQERGAVRNLARGRIANGEAVQEVEVHHAGIAGPRAAEVGWPIDHALRVSGACRRRDGEGEASEYQQTA